LHACLESARVALHSMGRSSPVAAVVGDASPPAMGSSFSASPGEGPIGQPLLEAMPFNLPTSHQGRCANYNIAVAASVGVAAIAAVAAVPQAVLDVGGIAAFGYVFFMFGFQNTFLEWPVLDWNLIMLLAGAVLALLLPTLLTVWGMWHLTGRLAAIVFDVVVVVLAWRHMVCGPVCHLPAGSLSGKTIVITGCNTGIGFETAEALARAGAKVVFACRSEGRARDAMKKLLQRAGEAKVTVTEDQLFFIPLDLSSLKSVRKFVELLTAEGLAIDRLILNAGVMLSNRALSEDGFEMTMASNHFGHFLLVNLLLPKLLEAEEHGRQPRIVCVSSNLCYLHDRFDFSEVVALAEDGTPRRTFQEKPYSIFRSYAQSKLANILFTTELAHRLQQRGSQIPVNALHPGEVMTEVMRDMHPVLVWLTVIFRPIVNGFIKNARQGSYNSLHVATAPNLATAKEGVSGGFFIRLAPAPLPEAGSDRAVAERFWDVSEKLTGLA